MVQVSGGQLITSSGQPIMVQAMSGGQGQTIMQVPVSGTQGLQQVSTLNRDKLSPHMSLSYKLRCKLVNCAAQHFLKADEKICHI